MASVDVVVVTHNSCEDIRACLDSVAASDHQGTVTTIVIDNASVDATESVVRAHPSAPKLVLNSENRGFAAACNQGVRAGTGDLVLLLNPDARLYPGTLDRLVTHLDRNPDVGIVGPSLVDPDGELKRDISATGIFPSFRQALHEYTRIGRLRPRSRWVREYFLTDWDRRGCRPVAMVQGACFLFRRSLALEIGPFDERFFLYFEETDFCKEAADRGWATHYVGDAAAVHVGSRSSPDARPSADHFIRSLYAFHHKHYGAVEAAALWAILAPYHGLRSVRLATLAPFRAKDPQLRADLRTASERFIAHLRVLQR